MKRILLFAFLAVPIFAAAQKPLMVEGTAPGLYLTHTVQPKENYYSVGRTYNISPKEIAPFNNLELEKGLSLNQVVKVPLTANNFLQGSGAAADEVLVPVYYTVKEKEGLYRISTNFNKVPVETLKQWNNIKADAVGNGTKLIVGYLKVKKDLSPLAGMAKAVTPANSNAAATKATTSPGKPDISNETLPVVKKPAEEKKPDVKPVAEKEKTIIVQKQEKKPELVVDPPPPPVKETAPPVVRETASSKDFSGGYFKSLYAEQAKSAKSGNESGLAAVFKSTSGWNDGKYYCLYNNAPAQTFVKITSKATGKTVYAKVLDVIPDISRNKDVLIMMSNAAAAELGSGEMKFDCSVAYVK